MDAQSIISQVDNELGYKSITINGKKYTITLLPASKGFTTAQKIVQLVLPSLGAGTDGVIASQSLFGGASTLTDVSLYLTSQMDKIDVLGLIKELLVDLKVDDKTVDFDIQFRQNYGELIEVVEFALKENFTSFFTHTGLMKKLEQFIDLLTAQMEAPQPSEPQES